MERTEVSTQQALREEEGAGGATCTARDDQLGGRGLDQGEDLLDRFNFSALQTTSATVRACGTCSGLATKREERDGREEILRGTEIFLITSSPPESVETFLCVSLGSKTQGGRAAPALIDAPLVS